MYVQIHRFSFSYLTVYTSVSVSTYVYRCDVSPVHSGQIGSDVRSDT